MRPLPSFLVVLGLLATVLLPAPARADQRTLAIAIARQVIVPGYQKLRVTTEAQATAWRGFCAAPKADGVDGLRLSALLAHDGGLPQSPLRHAVPGLLAAATGEFTLLDTLDKAGEPALAARLDRVRATLDTLV